MKSFVLFSILIISLSITCWDTIFAQSSGSNKNQLRWQQVTPPLLINYNLVYLTAPGEGYIGGMFILKLKNSELEILNPQPPAITIDAFFALSKNKIWAAHHLYTNESILYFFNGSKWKELYNPLANQILSIYFIDEKHGWVAGDRELAFFDGEKWMKYNDFPLIRGGITSVMGDRKNDFYTVIDGHLYHYLNGKWIFILANVHHLVKDLSGAKYVLSDNKLFLIEGNYLIKHTIVPFSGPFNALEVINRSNIYITSSGGYVYNFRNGNWKKSKVSTDQDLLAIKFFNDDGWLAGSNGAVFHYSQSKEKISSNEGGFKQVKVIPVAKELNEEYGVSIEDLNNDGFKDIYTACFFSPNRLYMNQQGTPINKHGLFFQEEAAKRNVTGFNSSNIPMQQPIYIGVGTADINNDGSEDIYLCNLLGRNALYLNDGSGYFDDVSQEKDRAVSESERSNSVAFADVNNDGWLDMFIANEETTNRLFVNNGAGFFKEATLESGLMTKGGGMCAAFSDFNNDSKPDLCVVNWSMKCLLYRNDSHDNIIKFTNITGYSGVGGNSYDKSNSVSFADINNDGFEDLFITKRKSSNCLLLGDGTGKFKDVTREYLGLDSMLSYGASVFDFDNDGYQDIFVANVGSSTLYKNVDGQRFINVTDNYNALVKGYCTGTATGDIDNDGDLDLYVSNYINGESSLLINNVNNKNFFTISVSGTRSNRDAIGTKVWLYQSGHCNDPSFLRGFREIHSGNGYCSHSSKEIHFGADSSKFYDIIISFPSGVKKVLLSQKPGQHLIIQEEEGWKAALSGSKRVFSGYLGDYNVQRKSLEILFVLLSFTASVKLGRRRYNLKINSLISIHFFILLIYAAESVYLRKSGVLLSSVIPLLSILVLLIITYLIYERIAILRVSKNDKQNIRRRIARDLHDDLASTLSSTQIYAEVLKHTEPINEKQIELIGKISTLLHDSSEAITDIIWDISPQHDKLDDLMMKLKTMTIETCRANAIKLTLNDNLKGIEINIPENIRRNIFLIYKESLTNVIKHSGTLKVNAEFLLSNKTLRIILEDSGKGMFSEEVHANNLDELKAQSEFKQYRNGLSNIFQRTKEINGTLQIITRPSKGTRLTLTVKIT